MFSTEEEGMVRHLFGLLYRMHLEATHARGALEFFHISKVRACGLIGVRAVSAYAYFAVSDVVQRVVHPESHAGMYMPPTCSCNCPCPTMHVQL